MSDAPKITVVTDKAKVSKANSKDRPFPLEWTRNIGIAAHIDAGNMGLMLGYKLAPELPIARSNQRHSRNKKGRQPPPRPAFFQNAAFHQIICLAHDVVSCSKWRVEIGAG